MPPPTPEPFEAGPTIFVMGLPTIGMLLSGNLMLVGAMMVGSAVSFGSGFLITMAGGVICGVIATLGRCPLGAWILLASPPPPPPPMVGPGLVMGMYSLMS